MFNSFLKSLSILKKFLFINLIIFIFIGSFTIVYLKSIQPSLIEDKTANHIQIIDNTINHINRLKISLQSLKINSPFKNLSSLHFILKYLIETGGFCILP